MRILRHYFASLLLAVILCAPVFFCASASAQDDESLQLSEQKIEAGLIYNFLKYTEWPKDKEPQSGASTIVCILGAEDPFNGYLQPIEEKTVKEHSIKLRHVSSTADVGDCHLLFVGTAEKLRWAGLRKLLADKHVLTVGDFPGFSDEGGMIEFGVREDHIYIELNVKAISAANLIIYSNLRRLSVTSHPPSEEK